MGGQALGKQQRSPAKIWKDVNPCLQKKRGSQDKEGKTPPTTKRNKTNENDGWKGGIGLSTQRRGATGSTRWTAWDTRAM